MQKIRYYKINEHIVWFNETAFKFECRFIFKFFIFEKNLRMKKLILFFLASSIGIFSMTSCKKKGCTDPTASNFNSAAKKDDGTCLYTPFINIIGSADTTISVGSTYNDPGATATNKDGSSATVTTVDQVNASTVGVYEVTYTASNSNGTSTAKRKVNVVVSSDNWLANWVVSSDCGASFPLNSTPTINLGANNSALVIDGMFSISIPSIPLVLPNGLNIASGGTANATINGATITVPSQSYDVSGIGTITYEGVGTMNATGTEFTVTYTYNNDLPAIGGSGTCTATYTKQ
jgi:hypothetical protein